MSEFLAKIPSLFVTFAGGATAALLFLAYYLRRPRTSDTKFAWDAHASLNTISKLAVQAQSGGMVNVELLYLLGEHLKNAAITQQNDGWLEAYQLNDWIESFIRLHHELSYGKSGVAQITVKLPVGIHRVDTRNLTRAMLANPYEMASASAISVVVNHPGVIEYARCTRHAKVTIKMNFESPEENQPRTIPNKFWQEAAGGALVYVGQCRYEHARTTGFRRN